MFCGAMVVSSANAAVSSVPDRRTSVSQVVLTIDVGGTDLKGALVTPLPALLGEVVTVPSHSEGAAELIVTALIHLLQALEAQARQNGRVPSAVALAVPGPFDLVEGVSLMEHKFAAIRGLSLRRLLGDAFGLPCTFVNDATAFGLGCAIRHGAEASRIVGITLGTGLGSAFIADGANVDGGDDVPPDGEVWNLPFRGGIFEDAVSARALAAAGDEPSVLAVRARQGDAAALDAFIDFGYALGEGLGPVARRFGAQLVMVGGGIAASWELFSEPFGAAMAQAGVATTKLRPAPEQGLALLGAANVALRRF